MIRTLYALQHLARYRRLALYDSLPPPICTFNQEEYELTTTAESDREILFTITNPTNDIVRIVGLADC